MWTNMTDLIDTIVVDCVWCYRKMEDGKLIGEKAGIWVF